MIFDHDYECPTCGQYDPPQPPEETTKYDWSQLFIGDPAPESTTVSEITTTTTFTTTVTTTVEETTTILETTTNLDTTTLLDTTTNEGITDEALISTITSVPEQAALVDDDNGDAMVDLLEAITTSKDEEHETTTSKPDPETTTTSKTAFKLCNQSLIFGVILPKKVNIYCYSLLKVYIIFFYL